MRRPLDVPSADPVWPPGVRVRPWRDDDAPRVHALLVEGYRHGGGEVAPFAEWRNAFVGDAEFDADACLVAESGDAPDGPLAGVALCWSSGFVKDLVVAEAWRRRGLGEALVLAVLARYRARGAAAIELKVQADNPSGAERLYRRLGFVAADAAPRREDQTVDPARLIERLACLPPALDALLAPLPDDAWRWRPADGGWSVLEIVNHLADEDPRDFRARLRSTLEDPSRDWAPIDPQGDVTRERFQERDPAESLARFRRERTASVAWLRAMPTAGPGAPDWSSARTHPTAGTLHAGDLLASWVAHDVRHLAQIARRLHGLAARDGDPYSVAYAG
jgi:ribosomal protein S18 acetylase RimI-like enzyme/uncharacterized damage-inducible protein DinB